MSGLFVITKLSESDPHKEIHIKIVRGDRKKAIDFIFEYLEDTTQLNAYSGDRIYYLGMKIELCWQKSGILPKLGRIEIPLGGRRRICFSDGVMGDLIAYDIWTSYSFRYYLYEVEFGNYGNDGIFEMSIFEH